MSTIKQFEHNGLVCTIKQMDGVGSLPSWLCGYVDVPATHPMHGKHYDDVDVDVHGGLTYSEKEGDVWRFGFDTAHFGDGPVERSEEYVTSQCERLAEQMGERGCTRGVPQPRGL